MWTSRHRPSTRSGCGGTRLLGAKGDTAIKSEVVWNDGSAGGATGGGVSSVFPLPSWQTGAHVPPSANPGGLAGRGVPDVSGDADPSTGYLVHADGKQIPVGGTSAVAPLWSALVGLINQQTTKAGGKPVGYLNPLLYSQALGSAGAFHDIVSGNNGAYDAAPGWDACTGLGSPDGTKLLAGVGGNVLATSGEGGWVRPHRAALEGRTSSVPARRRVTGNASTPPSSPIKNIVVVFQENHTFDNYFGTFPGADGTLGKAYCLPKTQGSKSCVSPFHDTNLTPVDMNHDWTTAHKDYDAGKMDGFVYSEGNQETMGYYDSGEIPRYWKAAQQYVLCDRYFTSVMSESQPNHLSLVAGTCGGITRRHRSRNYHLPPDLRAAGRSRHLVEGVQLHVMVPELRVCPEDPQRQGELRPARHRS